MRAAFALELPLKLMFAAPTIHALAERVEMALVQSAVADADESADAELQSGVL
jgi:hypothetical protein